MQRLLGISEKYVKQLQYLKESIQVNDKDESLESLSYHIVGPALMAYVWWILIDAKKNNIKRLYFLARDGQILREIALIFCMHFKLDIECKYLYCSRASLRKATYDFIGEEAYDLLFLGGYNVTLNVLLKRAGVNESDFEYFYRMLNMDKESAKMRLSIKQQNYIAKLLKKDSEYNKQVREMSRQALEPTLGYFKQEGMLDSDKVIIVDSGWTGSMQRSIRQLINKAEIDVKITGYYFGMYATAKEAKDGTYKTWCFNSKSDEKFKENFSNNLFECMLSASHAMTIGYIKKNDKYEPLFSKNYSRLMLSKIEEQQKGIISFVEEAIHKLEFNHFNEDIQLQFTKEIFAELMGNPTREEAKIYSDFAFCDDIVECNISSLVSREQTKLIKGYLIPSRVWTKFFKKGNVQQDLFWANGTLAYLSPRKRKWYKLNILIWERLKNILKNEKK